MINRFSMVSITLVLIFITGILILLLSLVDPSSVSAFGLLGVMTVVYVFFFVLFVFLYRVVKLLARFFGGSKTTKDTIKQQRNQRKTPYIIAVLAFVPLFLVSFNSLGQINNLNLSLIVLFEALAIFYIVKRV